MKYLKTYKIFESVNDDVYEKWAKIKSDYDKGLKEIKDEYLKGVSDCLLDLTDYYEYTSKVEIRDYSKAQDEYWKFMVNLVSNFEFEVPIDKVEEFMDTLIELNELVKSHISQHRRIVVMIVDIWITDSMVNHYTALSNLAIYSLENVKSKIMDVLEGPRTKRSSIQFAKIKIEI